MLPRRHPFANHARAAGRAAQLKNGTYLPGDHMALVWN